MSSKKDKTKKNISQTKFVEIKRKRDKLQEDYNKFNKLMREKTTAPSSEEIKKLKNLEKLVVDVTI